SNNVASSLIIGCAKLGIHINIGAPRRFTVRDDVIKYLKEQQLSSYLSIYENPLQAVKNVDVIYTDTFVSMGQEEESSYRLKIFEDYRVTTSLVKASEKEPLIMHCLPAHRDVEIESAVLDSKNSVVFDQAENRLHAQKALLLILLAKDEIKNID
ncbi:MAG: ornithine carbamoyltransferase, partial [Promethearchaeota archaeon]